MSGSFPPRLFVTSAPPLLDEKTRSMIEHLAEHKSAVEHDREEVAALSRERDRLAARVRQLADALTSAGIPIPPDADMPH